MLLRQSYTILFIGEHSYQGGKEVKYIKLGSPSLQFTPRCGVGREVSNFMIEYLGEIKIENMLTLCCVSGNQME